MEIDIRKEGQDISIIRIDDKSYSLPIVDVLVKTDVEVEIRDSTESPSQGLLILDKTHAENLIKGLQKAIDLGWLV